MSLIKQVHTKCRGPYPGTNIQRSSVPNDKVSWSVPFSEYKPVSYTAEVVLNKPVWADDDINGDNDTGSINFNALDGNVNRMSHEGLYTILNGFPQNIRGRTGMIGRGLLGRWGPNHAADPIVTRFVALKN